MAAQRQKPEPDTEVAATADAPAEAAPKAASTTRTYDSRKRVRVYDTVTGEKQPYPVPETHLDGRFPRLKQVPSTTTKES